MENLVRHTSRLIAHHKCVIIPGMGAFLAHEIPAYYNAGEQMFIPPHRTIGFNPQITADDSLLVSEYMSASGLSYEEAGKKVAKETGILHKELAAKGKVCFGSLGTFSMDINGCISFAAADSSIDDLYYFGLEPLAIQPLNEMREKEIVIKRRDLSRYMAAAIAAILIFFFVTPVGDRAYEPNMQASIAFVSPKEDVAKHIAVEKEEAADDIIYNISPVEDTVTEKIITAEAEEAVTAPVVEVATPKEEVATTTEKAAVSLPANKKTYSIIVASTPNAVNAELAIKELSAKHKAGYTIVEGNGRHRISIGDYETSRDASNALSEIKNIFHDAWVLSH